LTSSNSAKSKRERLFRKSRPLIRKYEETDNKFLWAAYQKGSFQMPEGLSQVDFLTEMTKQFGSFDLLWIVEDEHKGFRSGRGQVCLVGLKTDGWTFQPSAAFFKWATPKNVLRALVAFFQMIRHQKIGVCKVEVVEKEMKTLARLKEYGVLFLRGRIPFGSPAGDLFVFSINGRR
jgi:hypothetical protein